MVRYFALVASLGLLATGQATAADAPIRARVARIAPLRTPSAQRQKIGARLFLEPVGADPSVWVLGMGIRAQSVHGSGGQQTRTSWRDLWAYNAGSRLYLLGPVLTSEGAMERVTRYVPFVDVLRGQKRERYYGHPGNGEWNFYLGSQTVADVAAERRTWLQGRGVPNSALERIYLDAGNADSRQAVPTDHGLAHPGFAAYYR